MSRYSRRDHHGRRSSIAWRDLFALTVSARVTRGLAIALLLSLPMLLSLPVLGFDPFANSSGDPVVPTPPAVLFADPTDLEPLLSCTTAQIELNHPDAIRLNVRVGDIPLAVIDTTGVETLIVDLDLTGVPNGTVELTAELFDADDALLASASVDVVVTHPNLMLTPAPEENIVVVSLEGMDEDLLFLVLAADTLETSYYPTYDLELPLDSARSAVMAMGTFPAGYGGGTVQLEFDLSTSVASELHFVVLTFTVHGVWVPSNLASFELSQP